jgi:hypothetical protein
MVRSHGSKLGTHSQDHFLPSREYSRRELTNLAARKSTKALLWYAGLKLGSKLNSLGADWMYGANGTAELTDYIAPARLPRSQEGWLVLTGMGHRVGQRCLTLTK